MTRPGLMLAFMAAFSTTASAQGAQVPFGGLRGDPTKPVETSADTLDNSQTDGTAIFTGSVVIVQGEMKLSAQTVRVEYTSAGESKRSMNRSGGPSRPWTCSLSSSERLTT